MRNEMKRKLNVMYKFEVIGSVVLRLDTHPMVIWKGHLMAMEDSFDKGL